ncbi:MAG: hypothetical protein U9Q33_08565, partial [Campylobacterota bacterium]|nr:hypothetical protein [Campylobacterota bacterium]
MKNISGIKFIDARDIQTTSLKVTEKIQSKYLLQFIKNNLANQELFITTNSYFYYTFLESTSTYEIIIFNHQDSFNIILEPFLFETLYKDTNPQGYDIFFTDNYFTVYKNGEFLLLKQITDVSQEDIEIYVSQTYHMDINNVTYIDKTGLGQLKEKH